MEKRENGEGNIVMDRRERREERNIEMDGRERREERNIGRRERKEERNIEMDRRERREERNIGRETLNLKIMSHTSYHCATRCQRNITYCGRNLRISVIS
jgi:hypothetical protein